MAVFAFWWGGASYTPIGHQEDDDVERFASIEDAKASLRARYERGGDVVRRLRDDFGHRYTATPAVTENSYMLIYRDRLPDDPPGVGNEPDERLTLSFYPGDGVRKLRGVRRGKF